MEINDSEEEEHDKGVEADVMADRNFLSPTMQALGPALCARVIPVAIIIHK